jgi:predicted Ser/Thr protein kinase
MTPERWRQVTEVFHAARVRDASVRASYLEHACAGDGALRAEVDAMLAAHHDPGGFGDRPVSGPIDDVRRLETGAMLGPYRIDRLIGAGGMGEVYKARDTRLDRTVAIKILPETLAADPQFRERFDREARAISQLTHPHICTLYDVGEQQGTAFLVMEYLEGETLADRLKKGALPLDEGLKVAIQIAGALSTAHRHGIVHRDLKPGNVMLTKAGAKLLDFGLAKLKPGAAPAAARSGLPTADDPITAEGTILGTLHYMSPEQVEGKDTDARGDIFAFGAMVYEMATGTRAFEGKSQASVMAKILEHDPPPISTVQAMTPPALDRVVTRCLAKDPDDRWQTARDLEVELRWIAEGGGQITPRPSAAAHGVSRGDRGRCDLVSETGDFGRSAARVAFCDYAARGPAIFRHVPPRGCPVASRHPLGVRGEWPSQPPGDRSAQRHAHPGNGRNGNRRFWAKSVLLAGWPMDRVLASRRAQKSRHHWWGPREIV